MDHNSKLAYQVAEENVEKGFAIGSGTYSELASSPFVQQALGAGSDSDALVKERFNGLHKLARSISYAKLGKTESFREGATDKEISESSKGRVDLRFNSGEGQFLQRDLEFMDPTVFKTLYQAKTNWKTLMPQRTLNTPGADTYRYQFTDFAARARFKSDGATDTPMVNTNRKWYTKPVNSLDLGYVITVDEIRAHVFGNTPLQTDRIEAVMNGYDQSMYDITWFGDVDHDVQGLINDPTVANVVAPTRNASVTWVDKLAGAGGADDIIKDIVQFVSTANEASLDIFWNKSKPGILGVPLSQYNLIQGNNISSTNSSNISIKKYCVEQIDGLMDIVPILALDGQGTGATDLAFGWVPDKDVIEVVTTMPITWQPMQQKGFRFEYISDMKFVGPVLRYSNGFNQMYGI